MTWVRHSGDSPFMSFLCLTAQVLLILNLEKYAYNFAEKVVAKHVAAMLS